MRIEIEILELGSVELPHGHPRAATGTCTIHGAVVRHPDGVIVFDTGTADDHPIVNDLYRPTVVPLVEALHGVGVDERDVVAIVNSHLHFDHCGQNRSLPEVPVWVQRAEFALIDEPRFTVPEWAHVDAGRVRLLDGDAELLDGVRILHTPGHTPGHQSLAVDTEPGLVILGGQCCFDHCEFESTSMPDADAHDESWVEAGVASIRRLRSLDPAVVHLSHDPQPWRPR